MEEIKLTGEKFKFSAFDIEYKKLSDSFQSIMSFSFSFLIRMHYLEKKMQCFLEVHIIHVALKMFYS